MKKKYFSNPLFQTFKHTFVAMFGVVSAWAMIGLYSAIFTGIGYYLLSKYNKPNTDLLKELQTVQYVGLVFIFFGLLPFIQYFFVSFMFEGGEYAFNSIFNE
tara:strand:- start:694 stop:999 length:306 start_codon:yes stop_codon:yes gene_type:complete